MENERIIDRLRKVLALTQSPNEHEAASAAETLKKLLEKHNLSMADIEKRGAKAPSVTKGEFDLGKAAFRWKLRLAEEIAEHYYCFPIVYDWKKTVQFVGRPENVEALIMLYQWLMEQVKAISATERKAHEEKTGEHVDPLRWQVNFGLGIVSRLGERLAESKKKQQGEMARNEMGDVVALAVHHTGEINDYLEQTSGWRPDGKLTKAQQERYAKIDEEQRLKKEWLERDPAGYYEAYPDERPEAVALRRAERDAENAELAKREARNEKRREKAAQARGYYGRQSSGSYDPEEERRESQASDAERAGKAAADKVNLQPFLKGDVPQQDPGRKIGGGK